MAGPYAVPAGRIDARLREAMDDFQDCRICNEKDWEDEEVRKWIRSLRPGDPLVRADGMVRKHRKDWEHAVSLRCADKLGKLGGSSRVLGVASGHERIAYLLSNLVLGVMATDLYGDTDFSGDEADPGVLVDPDRYAPFPYRKDRLEFRHMDALDLRFDGETFDYAFSFSSIEHFGGLPQAIRAVEEMLRVTKRGGLVSVCTEYLLPGSDADHPEFFTKDEVSRIADLAGAELVGAIDWTVEDDPVRDFSPSVAKRARRKILNAFGRYPQYPYTHIAHDGYLWTSVHLAWVKN